MDNSFMRGGGGGTFDLFSGLNTFISSFFVDSLIQGKNISRIPVNIKNPTYPLTPNHFSV
jgi:hypothetical protein